MCDPQNAFSAALQRQVINEQMKQDRGTNTGRKKECTCRYSGGATTVVHQGDLAEGAWAFEGGALFVVDGYVHTTSLEDKELASDGACADDDVN